MPLNKSTTYHASPPPPLKEFPQNTCLEVISVMRPSSYAIYVRVRSPPPPPPFLVAPRPPPQVPTPPPPKSGPRMGRSCASPNASPPPPPPPVHRVHASCTVAVPYRTEVVYGCFYGGGGVIPTQSGRFFSSRRFSQKCRSVGGGSLYLFEISKKWPFRKGMGWGGGGGRWPYFFVPDRTGSFWRFGVCSNNLVWFGVVCIQRFMVLGLVLQHVVRMANFSE